jgi:sugar lactone lactonase YvrE
MLGFYDWPTQIAVDNDPSSPSYRDIYVPEIDTEQGQFNIEKYSPSGEHLATVESFFPVGVSVDPATGNVYTASYLGYIVINSPTGEIIGIDYIGEDSPEPEGIAVDSAGNAYVVNGGGQSERKGTTEVYHPEVTLFGEAHHIKQLDSRPSYGVALDVTDEHIYVDEGHQFSEFDSLGNQVGSPSGIESLTPPRSTSLAADSGTIDVSNPGGGNAVTFGPARRPFDPQTDNPLVIDSVSAPGERQTADIQVNPSGNDAAFASTLPLTGYDTGAIHREVYRYDSTDGIECASCSSTGQQATGEASLPPNGLGLSNDGRLFFNSTEGLVDRDLNEKEDAYEWEPQGYDFGHGAPRCETSIGCVELISSGSSPFPARLFGISSDGTDAYFFTRDKLVEQDENGNTVKLYDARSLGGYPFAFPEPQCRASDECHGPGTSQPPPPNIKSVTTTPGGNHVANPCKRGFVRKHGTCMRKHRARKHRHAHRRRGQRHG